MDIRPSLKMTVAGRCFVSLPLGEGGSADCAETDEVFHAFLDLPHPPQACPYNIRLCRSWPEGKAQINVRLYTANQASTAFYEEPFFLNRAEMFYSVMFLPRLYSVGVTPSSAENIRIRWEVSKQPTSAAICEIGSEVSDRRFFASSTR